MIRVFVAVCLLLAGGAWRGPSLGATLTLPTVTVTAPASGDPTAGILPPYNDAYANWNIAGLAKVGGIPTRNAVCATVTPSGITNPPQANDDVARINVAITSCPLGQVVMLASGTFTISQTETVLINKGVTIRGSGSCNNAGFPYCSTYINVYDGAVIYVTGGGCAVNSAGPSTSGCSGLPPFLMAHQQYNNWWSGCSYNVDSCSNAIELTADAAQGATTVQVASNTHLSVGQWVMIDEASGAGWLPDPITAEGGQVWGSSDALNSSGSPARGNVIWQKHNPSVAFVDDYGSGVYPYQLGTLACDWTFCDRPTEEIKLISAIEPGPCPCVVTFDSPLTTAFRKSGSISFNGAVSGGTLITTGDSCTLTVGQIVDGAGMPNGNYVTAVNSCRNGAGNYTLSAGGLSIASEPMIGAAHQARLYWQTNTNSLTPIPFITNAGLENVSINRPGSACVQMINTAYSWVKNVDCKYWFQGAFKVIASARDQVTRNFAENGADNENTGVEYAIDQESGSTEILFDDNISVLGGKAMVARAAGAGSVVAYNDFDETYYLLASTSDAWIEIGVNGSHLGTPHQTLFEGNFGQNLDSDNTHGASQYMTYFRNWGAGYRSAFTNPSTGKPVNDATSSGNGPLRGAGPMGYSYWFAYVGNVLGTSGLSTAANGWRNLCSDNRCIWYSGWANWASSAGAYLTDTNLATFGNSAYILRHANYDYLGNTAVYASGYSHTLPNSLYVASKPAFFSAGKGYTWPWVNPIGAPQLFTLPAKARFDAGTPFIQP